MKLFELINAREALLALAGKRLTNFKISLSISALVRKADEEFDSYNKEAQKLIEAYCERDDNGNLVPAPRGGFKIKQGNEKLYMDEHNDLLNSDISERFGTERIKISSSDFRSPDDFLTPKEMSTLEPLVEWVE